MILQDDQNEEPFSCFNFYLVTMIEKKVSSKVCLRDCRPNGAKRGEVLSWSKRVSVRSVSDYLIGLNYILKMEVDWGDSILSQR